MLRMRYLTLACNLLALGLLAAHTKVQADESFVVPNRVANILQKHCLDCHGDGSSEGDVQLDVLTKLTADARISLLSKVQEQLHLNQMPPADEPQPSGQDREQLVTWVRSVLAEAGRGAAFQQKMQRPEYGNHVDHGERRGERSRCFQHRSRRLLHQAG